jgi:predicted alpha/beta hydrolase family esterase
VRGFSPIPLARFPFPSVVVASTNDPRVEFKRAELFARSWGSRFVAVSEAGHINEDSGLGE